MEICHFVTLIGSGALCMTVMALAMAFANGLPLQRSISQQAQHITPPAPATTPVHQPALQDTDVQGLYVFNTV